MSDDPKTLWKDQPVTISTYSTDDLRARLGKQQKGLRGRNMIEYVAGGFVVLGFGAFAFILPDTVVRAACGLIVLGALVTLWQLHRRASADDVPAEGDLIAFQRGQLERQRAALSQVGLWYLGPLAPGMALLLFGFWRMGISPATVLTTAAAALGMFSLIWIANHLAARHLASQIRDLDS